MCRQQNWHYIFPNALLCYCFMVKTAAVERLCSNVVLYWPVCSVTWSLKLSPYLGSEMSFHPWIYVLRNDWTPLLLVPAASMFLMNRWYTSSRAYCVCDIRRRGSVIGVRCWCLSDGFPHWCALFRECGEFLSACVRVCVSLCFPCSAKSVARIPLPPLLAPPPLR